MYNSIYNIINLAVFGGSLTSGSIEAEVTTWFALALSLLVVYLPFKAIISFVESICGSWR